MRSIWMLSVLLFVGGICAAQDTNFPVGPQYLMTTDSMQFLHPIATPSLSLNAPLPSGPALPEAETTAETPAYTQNPALETQADLFPIYYGYPRVSVVEVTEPEETPSLPESMTGVMGGFTSASALEAQGYGAPLGEISSYWKAHKTAPRIYTNADIQRLPSK